MFMRCVVLGAAVVVACASSVELLLDDAGQYIHPGTAWTKAEGDCAQAGYEGGFHHNNGVHNGQSFATWNFTIAKNGCYWVEEFHPDTSGCGFNLSSSVPVHIHFHKGLHTTGIVDQSQRAGQWNRLTKLPFYDSHAAAIHISAMGLKFKATGVWAADAFRLTWHAKNCHDEEVESDEATAEKEEEETPKEEVRLPLLQALVDDADIKARGATLEPVSQCPATTSSTFHHDGLQKGRLAEATFPFDPPRDGCYLVEEMHPQLDKCGASANTKVHVNYCKGLQAVGVVDQTANGGQWTFIAALQFYAGHLGNVTLSNEGTEPGTLTVFDQVRFTWSGIDCLEADAHPRRAEIRMTVDFQHVANRLPEFGNDLKAKLAVLADVPENSLRLMGLRSGSIIAEFLVLPSIVDDPLRLTAALSPQQTIERLRAVVAFYTPELCTLVFGYVALPGGPLEGCNVEFKDLGFALPSTRPVVPVAGQRTQQQQQTDTQVPEQHTQQQQQADTQAHGNMNNVIIVVCAVIIAFCAVASTMILLVTLYRARFRKTKKMDPNLRAEVYAMKVASSMEEGKSVENQKPTEEDDSDSTLCPSNSDKQSDNRSEASQCVDVSRVCVCPSNSDKQSDNRSEPSLCVDVENVSTPEQVTRPVSTPEQVTRPSFCSAAAKKGRGSS